MTARTKIEMAMKSVVVSPKTGLIKVAFFHTHTFMLLNLD